MWYVYVCVCIYTPKNRDGFVYHLMSIIALEWSLWDHPTIQESASENNYYVYVVFCSGGLDHTATWPCMFLSRDTMNILNWTVLCGVGCCHTLKDFWLSWPPNINYQSHYPFPETRKMPTHISLRELFDAFLEA